MREGGVKNWKKKGGGGERKQEVATGQTALIQAGSFPGCQEVLDPHDAPACLCRGATGFNAPTHSFSFSALSRATPSLLCHGLEEL